MPWSHTVPATAATSPPAVTPPGDTVDVATAAQLRTALAAATPGRTIRLADGTYVGSWKVSGRPGTAAAPVVLVGGRGAVLRTSSGGGNVLQLTDADWWTVRGITVEHGQKGVMIDSSDHVTVDDVLVHDLTMEGIHFRTSSSDGTVQRSTITDTGQDGRGMGEGVYVGTANTLTDRSDRATIRDNVIGPLVRAEGVDIKEGTTGAVIAGNTFDGTGLTGANYDDSWVDVKGNGTLVVGNRGSRTTHAGFQTHTQVAGWGCGTVFQGNSADLTGAQGTGRYAIDVSGDDAATCPTTVYADNTVVGGDGLVTPGVPVLPVAGSTPTATPTPTSTPSSTACTAAAWSATAVYTGGATVSSGGALYRARWWTQGEVPGASGWGAWERLAAC
ncbi:carbohydrate binding protein [Luteimicrobium subarcticum]|uniref:Carbohydrate binding protein n=1 Tax=Luteimicrobium subarcticum TaxID=620910 RepID=A0A2M8WW17_9MICO|nr:carbohydrate binding protein [Luteimicrobium subarcticum]